MVEDFYRMLDLHKTMLEEVVGRTPKAMYTVCGADFCLCLFLDLALAKLTSFIFKPARVTFVWEVLCGHSIHFSPLG